MRLRNSVNEQDEWGILKIFIIIIKEKLALELYKSQQISLTQGAKILSMDIYEFMNFVSKNGILVIDDYDIEDEVANAKRIYQFTS